jgi:hypothetical protein
MNQKVNTEYISMFNQDYYDFEEFEIITNNIRNHLITAFEAIIELTQIDHEAAKNIFDISSHDLQQLKRLSCSSSADLINANPELLTFNLNEDQVNKAKETTLSPYHKYKDSELSPIIKKFCDAQANSVLELRELVKSGGSDLAKLLYQINGNGIELLLNMRPSEVHSIANKLESVLAFNQKFSRIPIDDTLLLMSSTSKHSSSVRTMLVDSILNSQNHENAQENFQAKMLTGISLRKTISLESNIPENSALVWAANRSTSTDKFIKLYLASNFKKILKAKITHNKENNINDKIFPKDKSELSRKSNSFSWASGRIEQLKIYLLVSMYTTIFDNNTFKRFPTLYEITILCYAFELKYRLRNTDTLVMDLSHVHGIIGKIPLIYGNHLDKSAPGHEYLRKKDEDPQPGFVKAMCLKCSADFYITRSSQTQKCVWCNEGLHKKTLRKIRKIRRIIE